MPFCPRCGYEYRAGIDRCPDCREALVQSLPPEEEPVEFTDYREVLSTYNPFDIAIVKSILDAEGIRYFFQGEQFLYVQPFALPARLMVETGQAEEAMEILKDLDLTIVASRIDDTAEQEESEES